MIDIFVPEALAAEVVETRRDLHRHPELGFAEHRTAKIAADRLREVMTALALDAARNAP